MPAILVCDTHAGVHSASAFWHDVNYKLFQHIADTCVKRDISTILHLGDFFQDRKALSLLTLDAAIKTAKLLTDFKTYILLGNHDLFYKYQSKPTSLDIFSAFENIEIVDELKTINIDGYDLTLAPWTVETIPACETLLGHFEVTGFGFPVKFKYEIGDFDKCGQVYSGHFHSPSEQANIRYLGAPYHMEFGETGDHRGYYIFDHGNLEFIEFDEYPRFKKLVACEELTEAQIAGNIVKLMFREDYGINKNNAIIELAQSYKPVQLHTDFSQMVMKDEGTEPEQYMADITNIELKSSVEILYDYIDTRTLPESIKAPILKRVMDSLMKEK